MKIQDLLDKVITFADSIKTIECGFEPGMKARVVEIRPHEHGLFEVFCNFSDFEELNRKYMTPNYYDNDNDNRPTKRWDETPYYPANKIESFYVEEFKLDWCTWEKPTLEAQLKAILKFAGEHRYNEAINALKLHDHIIQCGLNK